ncbi:MAG: tetrahydrofolate dehydrogenase/cyclohydrolase catalytic domain-containing protein [Candidatus Rariloculaceae bacterium]
MSSPILLDGKKLAQSTEAEIAARVETYKTRSGGRVPALATILVGSDPASATYVSMKGNACGRVGMESLKVELPDSTTTEELLNAIDGLNENPDVHGILLQHPVPSQIDERACFDRISIEKDVDGVTSLGFGLMAMGEPAFGSCTPGGIMRLLDHYKLDIEGKDAVVLGRSPILGKPMALMLLNRNATVTVCHSRTKDLPGIVRKADIVVAAVGRPRFVKGDWIKEGAVVIDAGAHPEKCGDVDLEAAIPRSNAYTPYPGGVGPMTINTLILQTLRSAERTLEE